MEIESGVFRLECTKGSYVYAVRETDGTTLIDTGIPGKSEAILHELAAKGIRPRDVTLVLITHSDFDHVGNAAKLAAECGCPVCMSAEDIACLEGTAKTSFSKRTAMMLYRREVLGVARPLPEGSVGSIKIIPTPGHTPGHCCFQYRNVLFAGDLIRTANLEVTPSLPVFTVNAGLSAKSVWELPTADVKWICPAHGHPILAHPAWEEYMAVLRGRALGPARE